MTSVAIVGWSVFPILKRELLEKRKNSEWLEPPSLKILKLISEQAETRDGDIGTRT